MNKVIAILFSFTSVLLSQILHAQTVDERIQEAQDYLNLKPGQTLQILQKEEQQIHKTDEKRQIDAWLTGLWAGVYISDKEAISKYSEKLLNINDKNALGGQLNRILTAISAQLWREGDKATASLFARCGLVHVKQQRRLYSTTLLLGTTLTEEDKATVETIYKTGLRLIKNKRDLRYIAAFNNNLGVISLGNQKYQEAENYFKKALDIRHEIAHRSGQVAAGNNLMLAYLFLEDWQKFERIQLRIAHLVEQYESKLFRNYYDWLSTAFELKDEGSLSELKIAKLQGYFDNIEEKSIRKYLYQVSQRMNFPIKYNSAPTDFKNDHSSIKNTFSVCDWEALEQWRTTSLPSRITQAYSKLNNQKAAQ